MHSLTYYTFLYSIVNNSISESKNDCDMFILFQLRIISQWFFLWNPYTEITSLGFWVGIAANLSTKRDFVTASFPRQYILFRVSSMPYNETFHRVATVLFLSNYNNLICGEKTSKHLICSRLKCVLDKFLIKSFQI